jgi:hypothetical protein
MGSTQQAKTTFRIVPPLTVPPIRVHCPRLGCQYVAVAVREGAAIQAIAAHLVNIHCLPTMKEAS